MASVKMPISGAILLSWRSAQVSSDLSALSRTTVVNTTVKLIFRNSKINTRHRNIKTHFITQRFKTSETPVVKVDKYFAFITSIKRHCL